MDRTLPIKLLAQARMMSLSNTDIWIVVPGFNESPFIGTVLKKISAFTKKIIVVDDGSQDNTAQIARKYTNHVLVHPINLGKGAALKTGCEYAFGKCRADSVIFIDSDDQHDPNELTKFAQELQKGSPVVFGLRAFDQRMPLIRIILNRVASVLIFFLFGAYVPDIPNGYKALSREAFQIIAWDSPDYAVETEIAARVAKNRVPFTVVQVSTIYHDLDRGMTILDTLKIVLRIVNWRINL